MLSFSSWTRFKYRVAKRRVEAKWRWVETHGSSFRSLEVRTPKDGCEQTTTTTSTTTTTTTTTVDGVCLAPPDAGVAYTVTEVDLEWSKFNVRATCGPRHYGHAHVFVCGTPDMLYSLTGCVWLSVPSWRHIAKCSENSETEWEISFVFRFKLQLQSEDAWLRPKWSRARLLLILLATTWRRHHWKLVLFLRSFLSSLHWRLGSYSLLGTGNLVRNLWEPHAKDTHRWDVTATCISAAKRDLRFFTLFFNPFSSMCYITAAGVAAVWREG